MSKDPAFLFYSKDFYEGTRTMLPEERACYIDLLIYQHQNGIIPLDLRRVLLYCNGIDEATLQATLIAKFKRTESGWINEKLSEVNDDRKIYSERQSVNGSVGAFWRKSKAILDEKKYAQLKSLFFKKTTQEVFDIIKNLEINQASLLGLLKHLAIGNANGDAIAIEDSNKIEDNNIYTEIVEIFNSTCKDLPRVEKITEARKKAINARIKEYSLETIGEVFRKVADSDFLSGRKGDWRTTFDWIFVPANFIKILEDNYKNISNGNNNSSKSDAEIKESTVNAVNEFFGIQQQG